jgi:CRISPR-associated protein (TIGR02584 family)
VHLLTTTEGAVRARLLLLDGGRGHFHAFCSEYGLPELKNAFDASSIHVVRDAKGAPLRDIISEEDNAAVADTIMREIRALCADKTCAVHASVAGGRKTMGVALALAMSLFGRPQDALSHVLVSPPFESHPEFFYPPKEPRVLLVGAPPQQRPYSTAKADVQLAEIPFLRLHGLLDPALLAGADSWHDVIARAQASIGPARLVIDTQKGRIAINGRDVPFSPANAAFLLMLARCAREGRAAQCPPEAAPDKELARAFLAAMDDFGFVGDRHARTRDALKAGMEKSFFERRKNGVNTTLKDALGPGPARHVLITRERRPDGGYIHRLPLPPEHIEII